MNDLLADFDPLSKHAARQEQQQQKAFPTKDLTQVNQDVIRRQEERQREILSPLEETMMAESSAPIRPVRTSRTRRTSFSPTTSTSPSRPEFSPTNSSLFMSASPPRAAVDSLESLNHHPPRRRRLSSHASYSEFVGAVSDWEPFESTSAAVSADTQSPFAVTSSPAVDTGHFRDDSISSDSPSSSSIILSRSEALANAVSSAMQSSVAHEAAALGTSLKNGWKNVKAQKMHFPAVERAALFRSESTPQPTTAKPAFNYISGAPGFDASEERRRNWNTGQWSLSTSDPPSVLELKGARPDLKTALQLDLAESLRPSLPSRLRLAGTWTLLYSLDQHGVSLSTLYARVQAGMQGRGVGVGCLLVVQDSEGNQFGSFSNEPIRKQDSYFGSGECFLWKAEPFAPGDFRVGVGVKAFKWTGRNQYMVLCDDQYISFGGGEGNFGLWIDAAFEKGSSARCSTYDNEILSSSAGMHKISGKEEGRFDVFKVEVWRIG